MNFTGLYKGYTRLRDIIPIMENQLEKTIHNNMKAEKLRFSGFLGWSRFG